MPKPAKLHPKGKATSMQKSHKTEKETGESNSDQESSVRQFELELCWCIQQLERNLCDKKKSEKEIQETWKVLQVLKNNNQPLIRKRQLMRSYFGDYRAKMQAEEKKLAKMASKMKITEKPEPKATFLRKSMFQSTGDSAFKFNFDITEDQANSSEKTSNTANCIDTEKKITNNCSTIENSGETVAASGDKTNNTEDSKKFKFTFSGSDFKFNFDVQK